MRATSKDCILRDKTTTWKCTALTDVHPACGPECPFHKTLMDEAMSRQKAEKRLANTKVSFVDMLQEGWDK